MSDRTDPQEAAKRRQRERAEAVESALDRADALLEAHDYPTTSEELAVEYANESLDLPNETETLGSVFDRLVDERFDSADEAREAVYRGLTGPAGSTAEYNEARDLAALDDAVQDADGTGR